MIYVIAITSAFLREYMEQKKEGALSRHPQCYIQLISAFYQPGF